MCELSELPLTGISLSFLFNFAHTISCGHIPSEAQPQTQATTMAPHQSLEEQGSTKEHEGQDMASDAMVPLDHAAQVSSDSASPADDETL